MAGSYLADDAVARWAYAIHLAAGAMPVAVYRRGERTRAGTTGARSLPADVGAAQRRILELIDSDQRSAIALPEAVDPPRRASM